MDFWSNRMHSPFVPIVATFKATRAVSSIWESTTSASWEPIATTPITKTTSTTTTTTKSTPLLFSFLQRWQSFYHLYVNTSSVFLSCNSEEEKNNEHWHHITAQGQCKPKTKTNRRKSRAWISCKKNDSLQCQAKEVIRLTYKIECYQLKRYQHLLSLHQKPHPFHQL